MDHVRSQLAPSGHRRDCRGGFDPTGGIQIWEADLSSADGYRLPLAFLIGFDILTHQRTKRLLQMAGEQHMKQLANTHPFRQIDQKSLVFWRN
jgi:hypothetical protein